MKIVALTSSIELAKKVSENMKIGLVQPQERRFPDGEMYIHVEDDLSGEDVFIIGNTRKDEDIIEMLLSISAVSDYSPKSLNLIIPYFGYARQHKRYNRGEPVSSQVFAEMLSLHSDTICTVEIHDEQTLKYSQKPFSNLHVFSSIAKHFIDKQIDYVVSPDDGGLDRAKTVASELNTEYFYIDKKRIDDRTVEMKMPDVKVNGKNVLIVDDIISTGGTIAMSSEILRKKGANKIYVSAVHGLFANGADEKILKYSDEINVTDTVQGKYTSISVYEEVSDYIKSFYVRA
ncbi:MAG: ribose-phosphate diphosphokinase [Thermoplasmata archaeon]